MIIGAMSFRLAITWRVALDQSPPPLRQPMHMGAANAVGRGINLRRVASGALTHISVSGQPPLLCRRLREQAQRDKHE